MTPLILIALLDSIHQEWLLYITLQRSSAHCSAPFLQSVHLVACASTFIDTRARIHKTREKKRRRREDKTSRLTQHTDHCCSLPRGNRQGREFATTGRALAKGALSRTASSMTCTTEHSLLPPAPSNDTTASTPMKQGDTSSPDRAPSKAQRPFLRRTPGSAPCTPAIPFPAII